MGVVVLPRVRVAVVCCSPLFLYAFMAWIGTILILYAVHTSMDKKISWILIFLFIGPSAR